VVGEAASDIADCDTDCIAAVGGDNNVGEAIQSPRRIDSVSARSMYVSINQQCEMDVFKSTHANRQTDKQTNRHSNKQASNPLTYMSQCIFVYHCT
jgi:hypothetical protein